jgi:protocatechuate 3,4-dioxygenase beta subunit
MSAALSGSMLDNGRTGIGVNMKKSNMIYILVVLFMAAICLAAKTAATQESYAKTPSDYEGPFYPVTKQQDIDNDLIQVKGQTGVAKGNILKLSGVVVNTKGEAQKNLIIEIWQTDSQGRYNHPGDKTPGERDPNFQYWGAAATDTDGTFFFKTIIPGDYNPRPAHIHYKVLRDGKVILTSQIYFMEPNGRTRLPSMTSQIELQTVDLKPAQNGEFGAFFRIVI